MIAAKNPCWHSLSAFHNHPAARRYVRSTWNWSQIRGAACSAWRVKAGRNPIQLALCWPICRSWASLFHSGTPLARLLGVFLLTFDFFFAFWVAPGRMCGHPKTISRVRNYFFWCFVVRAGLQCEKIAHVQKPQFFLCFLCGFYILRAFSSRHITTQNHSRGLFNRASCKDCAPIPS